MATTTFFNACKKENFLVEKTTHPISELQNLSPTITIEEAKICYKKTLSDEESITAFSADSAVLLKAEPQWEDSKSGFSKLTDEFLIIPLALKADRNAQFKLLTTRQTDGSIIGKLVAYIPNPEYHAAKQGKYEIEDFTGTVIYTNLAGKFEYGFYIENGHYKGQCKAKRTEPSGGSSLQARGCVVRSYTICVNEYMFPFQSGCMYSIDVSETKCTDDLPPTRAGTPGGLGGSTGGGAWYSNQPSTVFTTNPLDVMRSKFFRAGLEDIWYRLELNSSLLTASNNFLDVKGWNETNKTALQNIINSTTEYSDLINYLNSLSTDIDFYNAALSNGLENTFISMRKYVKAGFSVAEFGQLMANNSLFQQVDAFLKTNGFTNENRLNVKGFTFLLGADDDFKTLNKNRGNKSIKQLLDEVGYPKINARTMMWLARKNGVTYFKDGKEEINFFRLGRIQEDAVIRSIQGVSKNTKAYQDPLGQRISTIPDIVTEGFTVRSENGIPKEIWSSPECSFLDSKFTATGIIKDNITTTDQGEIRQQLSTMIDVLANMKGVAYNSLIMPNWKPADHGIATLTIVTIHDAEIDPILVKQAKTKNVRMHKRWLELDLETQKIKVSTNFQLTVNPATNKGWDVPTLRSDAVDFNWSVQ